MIIVGIKKKKKKKKEFLHMCISKIFLIHTKKLSKFDADLENSVCIKLIVWKCFLFIICVFAEL